MKGNVKKRGQNRIIKKVLRENLCTGCGACLNLCPYFGHHRDHIVCLHDCDRQDGRCYEYCPRTLTDLNALQGALFAQDDITAELGALKGLYMTRAADKSLRAQAQHGGTVSALMALAISEGIIDAAIVADQNDRYQSDGTVAVNYRQVVRAAGSKFVAAPILGMFNEAARGEADKIGAVDTPCQALAMAKMRVNSTAEDKENIRKLKLVVGLFCGWALQWEKLRDLLNRKLGSTKVVGLDIPPSKHQCMAVTTAEGVVEIPMDDVQSCVRENCKYCFDLTCEFSDISVGSARSGDGWAVDKGWNQLIVRTDRGRELLDLAIKRGVLESKEVPDGNLEKLKKAALNKKMSCLKHLGEKAGNDNDLIYLSDEDPIVQQLRMIKRGN